MAETERESGRRAAGTFAQFYESHVDEVYGFLRVRTTAEVAEELTAEVFIAAFKKWESVDELEPGWLMTVAKRRLIDEWRRYRRTRDRLAHLLVVTPLWHGGPELQTETRMTVIEVLDQLPNHQRQALVLRYLDDLSVSAVADAVGRSYGATESLLSRARRNFEKLYAHDILHSDGLIGTHTQDHAYALSS